MSCIPLNIMTSELFGVLIMNDSLVILYNVKGIVKIHIV
jgi:hypothetical protein